ncbi:unnamed protein product [Hyaloperonospora brassicae]|uniref:N-acetyltransferase domain-containing protein n=1 Tax=Hyaloperonospora brassicae TaxID=162125 RepID=A0AAV0TQG3_HYABA|nr:unnamed protein product [Hyaloperonospora brassicae]
MTAVAYRCSVCGHDHVQGVKCAVCGHTGKSRVYECFQRRYTASAFTVQRLDDQLRDGSGALGAAVERTNNALWTLIRLLRRRIFPSMATDAPDDSTSHHLVAFVGDGPIGVARWRPAVGAEEGGGEGGHVIVLVEYVGIVETKRRQGYARRLLLAVVQDVEASYKRQPLQPQALVAPVSPDGFSSAAVKLFESIGFQSTFRVDGGEQRPFVRMQLPWGSLSHAV